MATVDPLKTPKPQTPGVPKVPSAQSVPGDPAGPQLQPDGTVGPSPAPQSSNATPVSSVTPDDPSVLNQLDRALGSNNPLIQRAVTQANQAGNRKGLLNSTMTTQAGVAGALDAALEIAKQEAGQGQELRLQGSELASRELISTLDRDVQERIANINVAAHDREKAVAATATFAAVYGDMYKSIQNNRDIPADERTQILDFISQIRDENFAILEQLYDFDLVWGPDLFA